MNIDLILIGKTDSAEMASLISAYQKRINFYTKFTITVLPDLRNRKSLSEEAQKKAEGGMLLSGIEASDYVVLLDERGAEVRSVDYAAWMQKRMGSGLKRLVFMIGGPYGFAPEVYARANDKLSLSKMTFSHQLVRIIFCEQLYRAFTIINREPYHHE